MNEFGRTILEKYGWTDGKGLGRDESGMVEPIKVNPNFHARGLGHDIGREFKDQWWDHVFNKTAGNMSVGTTEDGSVNIKKKDETELSQKDVPYANASSKHYSSFFKAGELDDKPKEKDMSLHLSFDEMFKLCGGRTGHKGARHGLTMSAKLARIKQQDLELMEKWQNTKDKHSREPEVSNEKIKKPKKKKKESTNDGESEGCDTSPLNESIHNDTESAQPEYLPKKHKKDKKRKKRDAETESQNSDSKEISSEESSPRGRSPVTDEVITPKLSKKERKLLAKSEECLGTPVQDGSEEEVTKKKKKKKKKKKEKDSEKESDVETEVVVFESEVVEKKKHKKKKRDRTESMIPEDPLDSNENTREKDELNSEGHDDQCHKRKKKKCKREKHHL